MILFRSMLTSLVVLTAATALGADWLTAPSYFTHEPETGMRVAQYAMNKPVFYPFDPTYVRSGYHHTRSTIRVGQSVDQFHIVEEWGRPVRPYGEWRFPFRPHSVPYPLWGPPFAGLTIVPPWPYYGGYSGGHGGGYGGHGGGYGGHGGGYGGHGGGYGGHGGGYGGHGYGPYPGPAPYGPAAPGWSGGDD